MHTHRPLASGRRHLLLLVLLACLTGCAGISRIPLDRASTARLTAVEGRLGIPADEVIVRAAPSGVSAATGGGLIPALIDASVSGSRQSAVEKDAGKFYEQVEAHDFRTIFGDALRSSLGTPAGLPSLKLTVSSRGFSKSEIDERRKALGPGEGFMGMRIWYEFTLDGRALFVAANVQLITSGSPTPTYANSFLYTSKPVTGPIALEAWSSDGGRALADAYREGGIEIARMIRMDIVGGSNEVLATENSKRQKAKVQIPFYGPFLMAANGALVPLTTDGFLVEKDAGRQIVRAEGGALYSVPTQ